MNTDIIYGGVAALPSDYESPDGDLTLSVNLLHEDGALRPVPAPSAILSLGEGWNAYLFKTPAQVKHYILWKEDNDRTLLRAVDSVGADVAFPLSEIADTICSVSAIGNVVLISAAGDIHYFLWKPAIAEYRYLGTGIPEISIDFALQGDVASLTYDTGGQTVIEESSVDQTVVGEWQEYLSKGFDDLIVQANYYDGAYYNIYNKWRKASLPFKLDAKFEKGKTYRINPLQLKSDEEDHTSRFGIYLYEGKPSDPPKTASRFFEAGHNQNKVFVPDRDYENIWCCVVCDGRYSIASHLSISIQIDVTESNQIYENCKVVKYTKEACDAVGAAINSFIAEKAHGKNRFIYPFFVRYAIRLYDGSYASMSSPRLMIPNSEYVPYVSFREQAPQLAARAFVCDLAYRINSPVDLSDWNDLITGIDVFVSEEIWPYDQGKEYDPTEMNFTFVKFENTNSYGILKSSHLGVEYSNGKYGMVRLQTAIKQFYETNTYEPMLVALGKRPKEEYMKQFLEVANFYHIYRIPFADIESGDFIVPEIEEGTLNSLDSRPTLDELNVSYSGYGGMRMYSYNQRMHLFGGNVRLPIPAEPRSLNPYSGDIVNSEYSQSEADIYVFLHTTEGDRIVHRHLNYSQSISKWYFYPDSRAYKLGIAFSETILPGTDAEFHSKGYAEYPLKPHPFINGAYAIADSMSVNSVIGASETYDESVSYDPIPFVSAAFSIYISEAMNPFAFRASSVASVGSTRVLALSSAAKALSQGQFGQFPLYAFTDEGVWALSVSSTGTYTAVQPITRDVCTAPDSITQLDSAVLFVSARGLMILEGSSVSPLTDLLNTRFPESAGDMPHFRELAKMILPLSAWAAEGMPLAPFPDFLQGASAGLSEVPSSPAGIIYDYTHQRIILFNPSLPYAYVLSLKSRKWGMIQSDIACKVNSYPEALAVDSAGRLVDFSRESSVSRGAVSAAALPQSPVDKIPCLFLSRPLKLGTPDILKTVDTVIHRGVFTPGSVSTVLYGSRDLVCWHLIWSSKDHFLRGFRGTPYKYFRFAGIATLAESDTIRGASVQFTPRLVNQPR